MQTKPTQKFRIGAPGGVPKKRVLTLLIAALVAVLVSSAAANATSPSSVDQSNPSPPSIQQTNECDPFPEVPDESCTGVPPGTQLTTHNGDLYVTTDGAVVDAMEVNGCIYVMADNVTIKRTKVNGWCWTGAISAGEGEYSGTLIEDVEVDGGATGSDVAGAALIGISDYTARRVNVHSGGRGFNMADNVVIEDSYIHDIYGFGDSHNSGIGTNSGTNITVRHNNIQCDIGEPGNPSPGGGCSGALVLYADDFPGQSGTVDQLLVEENLFNSGAGSYCMLLYNPRTDGEYVVQDNLFGVSYNPDCGEFGPADILMTENASLTWEDNTWYAPGESKHGEDVVPEITIDED